MSSIIYIFAEERSGSSWLSDQLATQFARSRSYIETSDDEEVNHYRLETIRANPARYSDTKTIYQTHLFPLLNVLATFPQAPVLIRTARRNVVEQMLSYFLLKRALAKVPRWEQMLPTYRVETVFANDPITLTSAELNGYLERRDERTKLWEQCELPKQTIFYEDLFTGVQVPALDLTLTFSQSRRLKKTEYEKSKCFANYAEIQEQMFKKGLV